MQREILLLGDPRLYERSEPVAFEERGMLAQLEQDLRDTLLAYRGKYGAGRAIAAPQIGVRKRVIYRHLDERTLFVNPVLEFPDGEQYEVMDDCMSFPGLLVRVKRFRRCVVRYKDADWNDHLLHPAGDMAELIQHEYDHLDGVLATMRAVDSRAFVYKAH